MKRLLLALAATAAFVAPTHAAPPAPNQINLDYRDWAVSLSSMKLISHRPTATF